MFIKVSRFACDMLVVLFLVVNVLLVDSCSHVVPGFILVSGHWQGYWHKIGSVHEQMMAIKVYLPCAEEFSWVFLGVCTQWKVANRYLSVHICFLILISIKTKQAIHTRWPLATQVESFWARTSTQVTFEPPPRPTPTHPKFMPYFCPYCRDRVPEDGNSISCDYCRKWCHLECTDLSVSQFEIFSKDKSFEWACSKCVTNVCN